MRIGMGWWAYKILTLHFKDTTVHLKQYIFPIDVKKREEFGHDGHQCNAQIKSGNWFKNMQQDYICPAMWSCCCCCSIIIIIAFRHGDLLGILLKQGDIVISVAWKKKPKNFITLHWGKRTDIMLSWSSSSNVVSNGCNWSNYYVHWE